MQLALRAFVLILFGAVCNLPAHCAEFSSTNSEARGGTKRGQTTTVSAEQRLLDAIPQLKWTRTFFVENGWLKPGQNGSTKVVCFSKKGYRLLGVTGDVEFLFEREVLFQLAFYVDGDEDFSKLYQEVKKSMPSGERRSGNAKSGSRIDWRVLGEMMEYRIGLVRRVFGEDVERSLEIDLVARKTVASVMLSRQRMELRSACLFVRSSNLKYAGPRSDDFGAGRCPCRFRTETAQFKCSRVIGLAQGRSLGRKNFL